MKRRSAPSRDRPLATSFHVNVFSRQRLFTASLQTDQPVDPMLLNHRQAITAD